MGDVGFFIIGVASGFWSLFKEVRRGLRTLEREKRNKEDAH